jgi:hypothetical protein
LIAAIVLPVAIFLLWNTPTFALVIALAALALFLLLVIEVLRARSARSSRPRTDADAVTLLTGELIAPPL